MHSVTQDMRYRQSLLEYAQKHGVSRASRKYNKSRSYIYFWKARYDGTRESLADRSRRPHSQQSPDASPPFGALPGTSSQASLSNMFDKPTRKGKFRAFWWYERRNRRSRAMRLGFRRVRRMPPIGFPLGQAHPSWVIIRSGVRLGLGSRRSMLSQAGFQKVRCTPRAGFPKEHAQPSWVPKGQALSPG